jgi:hypothetical protein
VSAALAMGGTTRPHRNAAAATHLVTNRCAFIFSPLKLARPLKSGSYSNKNGARMISTGANSGLEFVRPACADLGFTDFKARL